MAHVDPHPPAGWQFTAFREWHRREHPRTAYRVKPRVWTAAGLKRAEGMSEAERVTWKSCEPVLTGVTFTDLHVYLVLVLSELDAAGVGRMLHLAYLFERDPDYSEHHGKHRHRVILARTASEQMIQFARGHRIRIVRLEPEPQAPAQHAVPAAAQSAEGIGPSRLPPTEA